MNQTELLMRRRQVAAFIAADPVQIELKRLQPSTKTAAGGYVPGAEENIPPQRARIVQNRRRYTAGLVNSEAGEIPYTDYLLIAVHTTNIEVDDKFTWLGEHYEVEGIYGARQESVLAGLRFSGKGNRSGD